jgi:hypothetical protein
MEGGKFEKERDGGILGGALIEGRRVGRANASTFTGVGT